MSFVNPLFLVGSLAAVVPILLHLVKRAHARREEFPSLMFLRRISKRYIRFQKLRQLLLLLVRVLALVLLALAFSRPYIEMPLNASASGPGATAHIILLDNSLSMGFGDRWARGRSEAARIVRNARPGDKVALLHFSDVTVVAVPLTGDPARVLAGLEGENRLSDRATRYAQALRTAERLALDAGTVRRTIYLISDFQQTGLAADEQNYRLAGGIGLEARDLGEDSFTNLAVIDAQVRAGDDPGAGSRRVRASILCYGTRDRPGTRVSLMLDNRQIGQTSADLAVGTAKAVEFTLPSLGTGPHDVAVQVDDPALERDNRFLLRLNVSGNRPVLAVGGPASARRFPGAFLEAAINVPALSPFRLSSWTTRQFESSDKVPAGLLIWNAAVPSGERVRERLEAFVKGGGGLAVVVGDSTAPADFDRVFGGWLPVKLAAASSAQKQLPRPGEDFRLLTDISMDHPIFSPFRESGAGDFSATRFYRHARLSASGTARVLARLDDGSPALIGAEAGKGRVLIFCSSADDSGNDLPLKPVYAPLWQQMLRFLENFREDRLWYLVGEAVAPRKLLAETMSVPGAEGFDEKQAIVLVGPDRRRVPTDPASDSIVLDHAGLYEIRAENASAGIAVNVQPRESDLTHADSEGLVGGWTQRSADGLEPAVERGPRTPEELDRQRNFWRFLIVAAAALMIGEGFLSNRLILRQE